MIRRLTLLAFLAAAAVLSTAAGNSDIWRRKPAGLVLGLDFSGDRPSSPTGDTGTLSGTAAISGRVFTPGTGVLSYSDASKYSPTNGAGTDQPMSISAWVRFTTNSGDQGICGKIGGAAAGKWEYFFLARQTGTGPRFSLMGGNAVPTIGRHQATATATSTGVWYHYCVTYSASSETSSDIKIYLNGTQVDDSNDNNGSYTGTVDGTSPLYIGGQDVFNTIKGNMAGFLMFNRALTVPEIAQIYNAGAARIANGGTP